MWLAFLLMLGGVLTCSWIDAGHRLKNHDCMLSRTLTSGYHIRRRLLLTGTPIQNSLQELWSLLNFLLPAIFNSSENFEDWFNAPFTDRSDVSLTEEEQFLVIRRLHQVIRPFLLRRKKAEVEKFLPGKTQVILKCDMSAWQRLYYKQIMESGRVGLDIGTGKSRGLLNTAMQLRKCCNHPYLFLEGRDYDPRNRDELIRSSGKFELLDRLLPKLARTGHRVLLFSQMTRLMDILGDYLEWHGYKFLRLDGTTKTEERGTLLQKFNAPDSPFFMFLLSTRAGGLGLNLQTADTVILFDSDWNPQMDQQAEDRAHRIGQKKEVRVFVLVSVGSIEEEILERAKSKMGIDAKVIQAGLFNTTSTAQERREMLEEIMKRGSDVIGTDVPSEREINRLSARGDDEFDIFEEMDEERRLKEEYRSRLLEEHEVPEWVFLNDPKAKGEDGDPEVDTPEQKQVTGKRVRKEVMYTDVLSDSQWMKAIEDGEDVGAAVKVQLTKRSKRREQQQAALEQEVAEMLEVDENGDDETLNNSNDDVDADDEILSDEDLVTTTKAEHTELRYEEAEVKTTETRTRIVIKRRQQVEETHQVKEGSETRLRLMLRGDKAAAANWKGLQRKRSRHGAAMPKKKVPSGSGQRS
jgi:superfamily II DNA/RNA helicase